MERMIMKIEKTRLALIMGNIKKANKADVKSLIKTLTTGQNAHFTIMTTKVWAGTLLSKETETLTITKTEIGYNARIDIKDNIVEKQISTNNADYKTLTEVFAIARYILWI